MKTWTCQRVTGGVKCGHRNPMRYLLCLNCGKRRPPRRRAAHLAALDLDYAGFIELNGGEHCGICGRPPKPGKKLHRDHDHRTGQPRGLLCFPCNRALPSYVDRDWLDRARAYLERSVRPAA